MIFENITSDEPRGWLGGIDELVSIFLAEWRGAGGGMYDSCMLGCRYRLSRHQVSPHANGKQFLDAFFNLMLLFIWGVRL